VATAGYSVGADEQTSGRPSRSNEAMHMEFYHAFLKLEQHDHLERWKQGPRDTNATMELATSTNSGLPLDSLKIARRFETWYGIIAHERRIFETSNGTLGLGPRIMQVGDVVVVLFGGDDDRSKNVHVAAVLRPVGDLWRLVGPCFVYRFMTGKFYNQ
jgi:hypothetical protein